ncbi:MAG TPA: ATP-grasp domain-containing protein [Patescibacteria group bacterium]|nr:ATP-grasp domain-containing protein [Patescibacteria group bacterium]
MKPNPQTKPAPGRGPGLDEAPRVLLLLPTTTYKARDFLEAAAELGVEAVVGSDQPQVLESIAPGRTLTLPLQDARASAHVIVEFARFRPLQAIVPTDDQTAVVAAHAAQALGLPHNPPDAARAARRKDLLRERLQAAGVRTPRHRLLPADPPPTDAGLMALAAVQVFPCVLKPLFLSASRGVIRADSAEQFVAAFRRIQALLSRPEVTGRGDVEERRFILAEEFVPGPEVALEGLLTRGQLRVLALFDKPDPLDGPFFEETLYVTPSRLPPPAQEAIVATARAAARALGLAEGPVHAELRLGSDPRPGSEPGPWLIEMAARSIGGLCARALRFGVGITLEELILMHALRRDVEACVRERRPAGVLMLPIPRAGVLRQVRGIEAARAVPGVDEVSLTATIGQPVEPPPEGGAYLGFVFARGASAGEVETSLRAAGACIKARIAATDAEEAVQ